MTTPAEAAWRFALALLCGCGLGGVYSFLRPLRPKHTTLADSLFLVVLFHVWLQHSFGICGGDLRFGYFSGLFLGLILWELTAGKLLRPLFFGFWSVISAMLRFFLTPGKIFLQKSGQFIKFFFASWKKSVTIKWNHCRRPRHKTGGTHVQNSRASVIRQDQVPQNVDADQDRSVGGFAVVYGGPSDAAQRH